MSSAAGLRPVTLALGLVVIELIRSSTRPRAVRHLVALATLLAASTQCASPTDATTASTAPILNGVTDRTNTGAVGIVIDEPGFTSTCSGTLITPTLVLTARHCVSRLSTERVLCETYTDATGTHAATTALPPLAANLFRVTRSTLIDINADYNTVAEVLVPPDSTGVPFCGTDIALLRLTMPMNNGTPVEPRLDLPPRASERFVAVGYGISMPGARDQGLRRSRAGLIVGHVGIDSVDGIEVQAEAEWVGNTGVCPGDSGGPGLDVTGRVFGVVSRGSSSSCERPLYTRVDSWAQWLRDQARLAAAAAAIEPPAWVDPAPAESAREAESCRSPTHCEAGFGCAIIGNVWMCTSTNCAACPDDWTCASTHAGLACVPMAQATGDAGVDDAGEINADAAPDSGTGMTPPGCQCATRAPARSNGNGAMHSCALAVLASAVARSARTRTARRARGSSKVSPLRPPSRGARVPSPHSKQRDAPY